MENENVQYGIEQLKKSAIVVCGIINAVDDALEDRKVSAGEGIKIGIKSLPLIGIIKKLPEAKLEFNDLDEAERADLVACIEKEFDLRNDVAEQYAEQAMAALLQLSTGLTNRHNSD